MAARSKAFTLAEVLTVLAIVFIMSGALLAWRAPSAGGRKAEFEAERLSLWLSDRMARAAADGTAFMIIPYHSDGNMKIALNWLDESNLRETFESGGVRLAFESIASYFTYSGAQHTMTPALSVSFGAGKPSDRAHLSVSGQGFVKVSKDN